MTKNQNLKKNDNSGISKTFMDSGFVFNKSSTRIIILVEYLYNTFYSEIHYFY